MKKCALCISAEAGQNFIGSVQVCDACYNKWASAETNARMVVALDHDIESDERLVTCRAALEAARSALKAAQERLNQIEYGDP